MAAFNIAGHTLHSLLGLPTKTEFKELGDRLNQLQQSFSSIKYIIIDEMSMVGRKAFAQVDHRLRQAFLTNHKKCLVDAHACFLATLVNYHQSWTNHYIQPNPVHSFPRKE